MTTNAVLQGQSGKQRNARDTLADLAPLIVDVVLPLGAYYLLKDGLDTSTFAALAWSSAVPAARAGWSALTQRRINGLAALILAVNAVALLLGSVSGDPRLMLAKDSGVSSTIGIGILVSVAVGKPMMTAGVKPFLVKGDAVKEAAWRRLRSGSEAFRRAELAFSTVWGAVLLGECVVRVVGAYTLPVGTMVWLGSVVMAGAMALGFVVSGALAARPMERLLAAEVRAARARAGVGQQETRPRQVSHLERHSGAR